MDAGDEGERLRPVTSHRRVFPELITEEEESVEEQVYGAAAETVVEWRRRARNRLVGLLLHIG